MRPPLRDTLTGSGTGIVMVLLLDKPSILNEEGVENIERIAVGETNLYLPGSPAVIAELDA